MQHDQFVGQVQHRAELASRGQAETAIRAVLETLAERLQPAAAAHIAAQLPTEIAIHLTTSHEFEHLPIETFYRYVAQKEHVRVDQAALHVAAVFETLRDALTPGAVRKLSGQLPHEYRELLEIKEFVF